jgi:hypothetical protein
VSRVLCYNEELYGCNLKKESPRRKTSRNILPYPWTLQCCITAVHTIDVETLQHRNGIDHVIFFQRIVDLQVDY